MITSIAFGRYSDSFLTQPPAYNAYIDVKIPTLYDYDYIVLLHPCTNISDRWCFLFFLFLNIHVESTIWGYPHRIWVHIFYNNDCVINPYRHVGLVIVVNIQYNNRWKFDILLVRFDEWISTGYSITFPLAMILLII